ncbi:response regulator transcription factor [Pilimelia columellifera]|uniref:Response regulator transcription factor n=1 Tax=Pilimelia columellifera subsp. columellifera TaxID=706583 RepID=A0ABP6AGL0_9ACTN
MDRIPVCVVADDPISQVGVSSQLHERPEVALLSPDESASAHVALVVVESVDDVALRQLRTLRRTHDARLVLVATHVADGDLVAAVEAGIAGLLRRTEAEPERLVAVIQAAAHGDGTLPPDLLGRLLDQVGRLQRQVLSPRGLHFSGLADREVQVLRLVAEGLDTAEIATRLCYSQRTVKNVLHDVTTRLQLRNRSHAVAYAVRQGLI